MGLKSPWGQPHAGSSPAPGMMDNYQTRMYAELSPDARRLFHALAGLMTPDEWRRARDTLPHGGEAPCFTGCGPAPPSPPPTSVRAPFLRAGASPRRDVR